MRVLVLGATGHTGSHIREHLTAHGHNVTTFQRTAAGPGSIAGDRNRLEQSTDALRSARPDIIVDTIAFTERHARSLVAVFRGHVPRAVVLSSGDVYRAYDILFRRIDAAIEPTPLTESSPLRNRLYPYRNAAIPELYGFSWSEYEKILVERTVLDSPGISATVLRVPMLYGPGAREFQKRRFYAYLKRMDDGRRAILLDRRTAAWRAPWGYAGDIAEAVRLVIENDRADGQIYNVAENDGLDTRGMVRQLAQAAGWTGEVVIVDEPCPPPSAPRSLNLDQHLNMDSTKIRQELGYREVLSRTEALERTIAWDREHPPRDIDPAQFDYTAEDEILRRAR